MKFKGSLLEARIKIIEEILNRLDKRIKKLEQKDSYYPVSENEIRNIKVGGTD